jgi:hypothetical protein
MMLTVPLIERDAAVVAICATWEAMISARNGITRHNSVYSEATQFVPTKTVRPLKIGSR